MLAKALQGSRSQLLQVIREMLVDERLERVEQLVGESLSDNAMAQKVRSYIFELFKSILISSSSR